MKEKDLTPEQREQLKKLKSTVGQYSGKSEEELINELMRYKRSNPQTMSDEKLEKFSRKVAPMLNDEQKKKLDKVMRELKNPRT